MSSFVGPSVDAEVLNLLTGLVRGVPDPAGALEGESGGHRRIRSRRLSKDKITEVKCSVTDPPDKVDLCLPILALSVAEKLISRKEDRRQN